MKKYIILIFISITCAEIPAQVIDYAIDSNFDSGNILTKGDAKDILLTSDNNYLVTGSYSQSQAAVQAAALFSSTGQLLNALNFEDRAAVEYKNGIIRFKYGLKRMTADWSYDPSFTFEFQKQLYSGPLSNWVWDALILPDDQILVAGRFFADSALMNTSNEFQGIRQLCLVDSMGAPIPGFPMVHCAQPIDAAIFTIDTLSSGKYIIAGQFDEVNGHPYKNIARLNSDFTVDTEFQTNLNSQLLEVYCIDTQDRILLGLSGGGSFISQPDSIIQYTRLTSTGERDFSFNPPLLQTLLGENDDILVDKAPFDIVEDEDGTLILGGNFVFANGNPVNRLIKIEDDGTIVEGAFSGLGADSAVWFGWEPSISQIVSTKISKILKLPDGKLLIGGSFSSFGGEPYNCLVKLEPSGFVGLKEKQRRGRLVIYPNPSGNTIRINLPDENLRISEIRIYNVHGVLVKKNDIDEPFAEINVSALISGIYFVEGLSNDGGIFTEKLIKK